MSWIRFQKVTRTFGATRVLDGVSFQLAADTHLGLVGENGGGKSTILRLMAGLDRPDGGTIGIARSITTAYLPQHPVPTASTAFLEGMTARPRLAQLHRTITELESLQSDENGLDEENANRYAEALADYAEMGGYDFEQSVRKALEDLGLPQSAQDQPIGQLSGGEQARVALARTLLTEADLLLLDEPDNHLDQAGLEWLEGLLQRRRGAFVLITHDRTLLERVATTILEIEDGHATVQQGSFAAFLERKRQRLERQMHDWISQQRRVRKLRESIREVEQHARNIEASTVNFYFRKRAMKVAARAVVMKNRIERQLSSESAIQKPRMEREIPRMQLEASASRGSWLLRAEGLVKDFGPRRILGGVDLDLERGQRVAIVGPNGAGKTTLLEALLGLQSIEEGTIWRAADAKVYYCDQHHGGLDPHKTVLEQVAAETELDPTQLRYLLSQLLFTQDAVHKTVGDLSGGERTRLVLALLVNARADVLVLDEPTNHLDLAGTAMLEQALLEFPGAVLFVTHDRHLIQTVATDILNLRCGLLAPQPIPLGDQAVSRAHAASADLV